jgi:hypothetical protein
MAFPTDTFRLTSAEIQKIVPGFVESDYPIFVEFIRAYYEWLEQDSNVLGTTKRLLSYRDVESTLDAFTEHFRSQYLRNLPQDSAVTTATLVNFAKDLYTRRGSPAAAALLFRMIFNKSIEIAYPYLNILRSSDGIWTTTTSIRCRYVDGAEGFAGTTVVGDTSGASAFVETVNVYFVGDYHVAELFFNAPTLVGLFSIDENVSNGVLTTSIFGGVTGITVNASGQDYQVGDPVRFLEGRLLGGGGFDASAEVGAAASDGVVSVDIVSGGDGYIVGDQLIFDNSGTGGTGAAGVVTKISAGNLLDEDGASHLTITDVDGLTYRLQLEDINYYNTSLVITPFLPVAINAVNYDTISDHTLATANIASQFLVTIDGVQHPFMVGGVQRYYGEIVQVQITAAGSGYVKRPSVSVIDATAIAIAANSGIDIYTSASLIAAAGSGQVKKIKVDNPGVGYSTPPVLSLANSGDGNCTATAEIGAVIVSDGFYINSQGQPSADQFFEDDRYYQPYSYVIRVEESMQTYYNMVKKLIHPAGSIFFGEYQFTDVVDVAPQILSQAGRDIPQQTTFLLPLSSQNFDINTDKWILIDRTQIDQRNTNNFPDVAPWGIGDDVWYGHNDDIIYLYSEQAISDSYPNRVLYKTPSAYYRLDEVGYNRQVMALTPDAFWKMDEASGNLVDSSGNGKTATKNGTPTYGIAGPISDGLNAISFGGSDYFDAGNNFGYSGTASFSFVAWVYITSVDPSTYRRLASKEDSSGGRQGWLVAVVPSSDLTHGGGITFERWLNGANQSVQTSGALTLNSWNLIVATYDGTTMRLSLNGGAFTSSPSAISMATNTNGFTLGTDSITHTNGLIGRIARASVVSRAISAGEVTALYAARTQTDPTVSNQAADFSGNSHAATYKQGIVLNASGAIADNDPAARGIGSGYLTAGNVAALRSNNVSFEAWVNLSANSAGATYYIGGVGSTAPKGYYMVAHDIGAGLVFSWNVYDGTAGREATIGTVIVPGTWYHVVGTYDGVNTRLYLNGSLVSTDTHGVANINYGVYTDFVIGQLQDLVAARYFPGTLDEVTVYNYALTANEVALHYELAAFNITIDGFNGILDAISKYDMTRTTFLTSPV